MASGMFKTLPAELLGEIGRALPFDDCRRLSAVDARFRQLLAPRLFSTLRASNRPSEQDIIAQVVAKYGFHARHLSLTMDLDGLEDPLSDSEDEDNEDGKPRYADWATHGLPNPTRNLLAGQTLPDISAVTIRFTSVPDDSVELGLEFDYDWEDLWGIPSDDDGEANLAYVEAYEKWRTCLAAMWQALTENRGLRRLATRNLLPVETTTWSQPAWSELLGRLETFELGLWGSPEGDAEWRLPQSYVSFLDTALPAHFYRHLAAPSSPLRRFVLAPHGSGYTIGGPDAYYLATQSKSMPHLRELRVEDRLVNKELAAFITRRGRSTLRTVELVDCFVGTDSVSDQAIDFSWEDFFDTISAAVDGGGNGNGHGSQLVLERFVLARTRPVKLGDDDEDTRRILGDHGFPRPSHGETHARQVQEMRDRVEQKLQKQKQRQLQQGLGERGSGTNDDVFGEAEILFPYVYARGDLEIGIIDCSLTNLCRADEGVDAAACKRLMDLVRVTQERRANQ